MDQFDFVIIGAGPGGEAAANEARARGASVAVIDRDLFGGSCPHWGCIPSKSLLHGAALHAEGADYPWSRASARRDYMINRVDRDYPDDGGHVRALEDVGATTYRGEGAIAGPGRVLVTPRRRDPRAGRHDHRARRRLGDEDPAHRGHRVHPHLDQQGRDRRPRAAAEPARPGWRPHRGRAGPGVPPVRCAGHGRPVRRAADPHRPSAQLGGGARRRCVGTAWRCGSACARCARRRASATARTRVILDDGSSVQGHATLLAVGRTFPLEGLGLETVGIDIRDRAGAAPRRSTPHRRRSLPRRRSGRAGAAHPPGALPGPDGGPDGAR